MTGFADRWSPISVRTGPQMANLVYKRVSTDQQSTARQNLVLAEAGIEDPIPFEEEAGTSSRLHPLQRPKFGELLAYARPGDTVHISEMFRLVRGTGHILDALDVLHRDRLALHIHDGAFSAMDLTARHTRTGELLSTVKFMVQTRRRRRTPARPPTGTDLRRAAGRRGQGQQGWTPPGCHGSEGRRCTRRIPGRPIHRWPGPRPPHQPRRHPYRCRRPPARAHRRRPGRPGSGAAGRPRHAGQGRRLPPLGRPRGSRYCGGAVGRH
ncbi:recombinase family protein [Streptomyces decoyicus]|uniref:recombinase family protein n=1 Tax=Streptomyces decoyicus TaxID=249567 RepID=UPI003640CE57